VRRRHHDQSHPIDWHSALHDGCADAVGLHRIFGLRRHTAAASVSDRERLLGAGGDAAQVSRATGLSTGLYTLSLFLFAPVWGHLSDRHGRRSILLIGLIGFSATMLTFSFIENLTAVYAERFLSGMFAAAVTPVALAVIGDLATTEEFRGRRLTFVSLAGIIADSDQAASCAQMTILDVRAGQAR
jgi:MFS family permease